MTETSRQDSAEHVVLLVGHGGIAKGTPSEWIAEFKKLESERSRTGQAEPSARERELDEKIRTFPRDASSDPYQAGLVAIGQQLATNLGARKLALAYNEFCAPSVNEALDVLVKGGARRITVLSTMVTPGGFHSDRELPELVAQARARHPGVAIRYVWPYSLGELGRFFARQVDLDEGQSS